MTKTDVAKRIVTVVVGFGISKIVSGIIRNNTTPERVSDQIAINAGSYVIGAMIADQAKKFTDAKIDEIVKHWNDMKDKKEETN